MTQNNPFKIDKFVLTERSRNFTFNNREYSSFFEKGCIGITLENLEIECENPSKLIMVFEYTSGGDVVEEYLETLPLYKNRTDMFLQKNTFILRLNKEIKAKPTSIKIWVTYELDVTKDNSDGNSIPFVMTVYFSKISE